MVRKREWIEARLQAAIAGAEMTPEQSAVIQAALDVLDPKDWNWPNK